MFVKEDKTSDKFFESRIGNKWLSVKEAAEYLRTTEGAIRNRIYRGQIVVYKPFSIRGKSLIKRSDLDQLIEASKQGGLL